MDSPSPEFPLFGAADCLPDPPGRILFALFFFELLLCSCALATFEFLILLEFLRTECTNVMQEKRRSQ